MEYGLQVFNDANVLQIDGKYRNMRLYAKYAFTSGTVVTTMPNVPSGMTYTPHTIRKFLVPVAQVPIPFIATTVLNDYGCSLGGVFREDNNWAIYVFYARRYQGSITHVEPTNAFVYIFAPYLLSISADTYGLQVFNEAAELVFASQDKVLAVKDRMRFYPGQGYLYSGSLNNLAYLWQGTEAYFVFNNEIYAEDNYAEVLDQYYCKTYYGYNNNMILESNNGVDPDNHNMPKLEAENFYTNSGNNIAREYFLNCPLPMLIDTSRY